MKETERASLELDLDLFMCERTKVFGSLSSFTANKTHTHTKTLKI